MPKYVPLSIGLATALVAGACSGGNGTPAAPQTMPPGPSCVKGENGQCLPLAPAARRVDLAKPVFSHPTSITNPLHATSKITQTLYGGQVGGKPFRTEVTLLPDIKTITWGGRQIKTLTQQYVAFLDGRLEEVALDWFGQADDGSVWYFGEDVYNYENGKVKDTEGTWLAGRNGAPPAMIMPAAPQVGDVYRPENLPGVVFEEVTVKAAGHAAQIPGGRRVEGAITVGELHMDGTREDKIFAPGYGEFSTGDVRGDLEAAVLAAPVDARPGPVPASLQAVATAAGQAYDAGDRRDWARAAAWLTSLRRGWASSQAERVPQLIGAQFDRGLGMLATGVAKQDPIRTRQGALDIAQAELSLRLRHQPPATVDRARLALWVKQLSADAAARQPDHMAGDIATLSWTWGRIRHTYTPPAAARIDAALSALRTVAKTENVHVMTEAIPALSNEVTPR